MAFGPYSVVFFDIGDTLVVAPNRWIPGAKEVLALLRAKRCRLGVISNTGTMTRQQLLEILPPDFNLGMFEDELILLSSEVGVEKPSLAIFRMAAARAGVAAGRALFCTETLLHTLVAQQVGLHVARLQSPPNSDIGSLVGNLEDLRKEIPEPARGRITREPR